MKLPVLSLRARETTLCTFCPKLCRPTCPISTVEGRETVTPWGKMRTMHQLVRGTLPETADHFSAAYACTGCGNCQRMCELDNPVADTLRDGRAEALDQDRAPAAVTKLVRDFSARLESIAERSRAVPLDEGSDAITHGSARTVVFPGCSHVVHDPAGTATMVRGVASVVGAPVRAVTDTCCGSPLLEAGDREGFVRQLNAVVKATAGAHEVIVSDPGCAHALRVMAPRFGVKLPRVVHMVELFARNPEALAAVADAPDGAVVYHDACKLGRGLGLYDEPRSLLARALGKLPLELTDNREHGLCSGGGGLLPLSRPATADAITRELVHEIGHAAGETAKRTVVSACPTSCRRFEKQGLSAVPLGVLLAKAALAKAALAKAALAKADRSKVGA